MVPGASPGLIHQQPWLASKWVIQSGCIDTLGGGVGVCIAGSVGPTLQAGSAPFTPLSSDSFDSSSRFCWGGKAVGMAWREVCRP